MLKVLFPTEFAHLSALEVEILGLSLLSIRLHLALNGWIKGAQDSGGQESGVNAVVDSDGGDRDTYKYVLVVFFVEKYWLEMFMVGHTSGHLHDAVQTVDTIQGAALDRDTDHRKSGVSGGHTGEMGGAASSGDDNLDTAGSGTGGVFGHVLRGAVSGGDVDCGFDAEVLFKELESWNEGLEIAVRAHDDGHGGCRLRGARLLGLGLDVAALGADLVDHVDQGLDVCLGFVHGRRGDSDMAHLAAWFGGALAVEMDAGVGDGESMLCGLEVCVGGGTADDVEHDGGLTELEALRRDGEIEDGADMGIELRQGATFNGVVTGVVNAASNFAQDQTVVFEEEHFDTKNTLSVEGCDGLTC